MCTDCAESGRTRVVGRLTQTGLDGEVRRRDIGDFSESRSRHSMLKWTLGAVGGVGLATSAASMPSRIWNGADAILLRCMPAAPIPGIATSSICDPLVAALREDSPYPVRLIKAGNAPALSPTAVLIDVSIRPSPQRSTVLLAFRIRRASSVDDAEGEITPPAMPISFASSQALAASLDRALERVMPWRNARRPGRFRVRPAH